MAAFVHLSYIPANYLASFPGHSQMLSHSYGEKPLFLHSCISLVPSPSPHVQERGSGVLSDLSQLPDLRFVIICDDVEIEHKI